MNARTSNLKVLIRTGADSDTVTLLTLCFNDMARPGVPESTRLSNLASPIYTLSDHLVRSMDTPAPQRPPSPATTGHTVNHVGGPTAQGCPTTRPWELPPPLHWPQKVRSSQRHLASFPTGPDQEVVPDCCRSLGPEGKLQTPRAGNPALFLRGRA